jgi:hypothetical protein
MQAASQIFFTEPSLKRNRYIAQKLARTDRPKSTTQLQKSVVGFRFVTGQCQEGWQNRRTARAPTEAEEAKVEATNRNHEPESAYHPHGAKMPLKESPNCAHSHSIDSWAEPERELRDLNDDNLPEGPHAAPGEQNLAC